MCTNTLFIVKQPKHIYHLCVETLKYEFILLKRYVFGTTRVGNEPHIKKRLKMGQTYLKQAQKSFKPSPNLKPNASVQPKTSLDRPN